MADRQLRPVGDTQVLASVSNAARLLKEFGKGDREIGEQHARVRDAMLTEVLPSPDEGERGDLDREDTGVGNLGGKRECYRPTAGSEIDADRLGRRHLS